MKKYIKLTILCSSLLLYCCSGHELSMVPKNTVFTSNPKNNHFTNLQEGNKEERNSEEKPKEVITLTDDEQHKFNIFNFSLNLYINKNVSDTSPEHPAYQEFKDKIKKYKNFLNWISKDIQKQKELANAFTTVYNILKSKKEKYTNLTANDITLEQYITDDINKNLDPSLTDPNHSDISNLFNHIEPNLYLSPETDNNKILKLFKEGLINKSYSLNATLRW
ncbi:Mlp family lipoprotein [Borrelia puertoricensis]|uniref:Mlp family lipoprotein n=1 Tax=Borrelia puertoricensis TaxID=2756107 RepID=UPI001FF24E6E|nr:Mlp family lipoprotein [Borrelia puertoricensis]UPA18749.1 Mlp family lipoprotein [Borrelia puertoricensis]